MTWEDRFWPKVNKTDTCWFWTASVKPNGYGQFGVRKGVVRYAHRLAYELLVGPIPGGLELDHLCRVRHCVNPDHLEPVTRKENLRRGEVPWGVYQTLKTHCPQNHPYSGDNLIVRSNGARRCRACGRAYIKKAA